MARASQINHLSGLELQNYASTSIPGVQIIELARHVDESGSFTELMRLGASESGMQDGVLLDARGLPLRIAVVGETESEFHVRQINWSELEPGVVRAFHVHKRQTDVWFVPAHEKVLVLLADLRKWTDEVDEARDLQGRAWAVPQITQHQRVVLGDGRSRLLVIPPLVAHGFRSLLDHKSRLLYAVNVNFDPSPVWCDEWRLPWDTFGEEIWDIPNG